MKYWAYYVDRFEFLAPKEFHEIFGISFESLPQEIKDSLNKKGLKFSDIILFLVN